MSTKKENAAQGASDAELIAQVRTGDRTAFGDLYIRHGAAATTLARQFSRSAAQADDLVSEAFARVLDGMLAGKGPDTAFRAYLFTAIRNTAYDLARKDKRLQFTDDMERHDAAVEAADPVIADLEFGLIGRAFNSLPERWQTVLWHTQVEGQSAADVGVLLGLAPSAVTSLAFRAREGLREAYLQAHLADIDAASCQSTINRLGAWARGGLSRREKDQVDEHLQSCERCTALAAELSQISTSLRGLLGPLILGTAAAGYLATLPPVAPMVQRRASPRSGSTRVSRGAAGGVRFFALGGWRRSVAVGAVVIAGVAIALGAGHLTSKTSAVGASGELVPAAIAGVTGGPAASSGENTTGTGGVFTAGSPASTTGANAGEPAASNGSVVTTGDEPLRPRLTGLTPVPPMITPVRPGGNEPLPGNNAVPAAGGPGISVASSPVVSTGTPTTSTAPFSPASTGAPTTSTAPFSPASPVLAAPQPVLDSAASSISPNLTAGGAGTVTVRIRNGGTAASPAGGALTISAPAGFTLGASTVAQGLRRGGGAFVPTAPQCTDTGGTAICILPAIPAGGSVEAATNLSVAPTAKSGVVSVSLNSGPENRLAATVGSGYISLTLSAKGGLPRAATGVVTLQARSRVATPGSIFVPLHIADHMQIVGLMGAGRGCSVGGGRLVCGPDAVTAGVKVVVTVDRGGRPGPDPTAAAVDEGGRHLPAGELSISANPNGGYRAVDPVTLTPLSPLILGTTGSMLLIGHPAPGVIDPGPITVPIALAGGVGIDLAGLPNGCAATGSAVVCTPAGNGGSARFTLPVKVTPSASGGTAASVLLPDGVSVAPTGSDGTPAAIAPVASGYASITGQVSGLNAGSDTVLTLTGTTAAGVGNAGNISLSATLADGVSIIGGDCVIASNTVTCAADVTGAPHTWKLTVHVAQGAPQFTLGALPTVTLAGGGVITPTLMPGADLTIRAAATATCVPPAVLGNSDFEAPVVPAGAGRDVIDSDGTGWHTTEVDHLVEFWSDGGNVAQANGGMPITAQNGRSWVELNANAASALYQDLPTVPGQLFHWSIWHRARNVGAAAGHDQDVMQVQIGGSGTIRSAADVTVVSDGPGAWVHHTGAYTVPPGQNRTRFQFAAVSSASGNIAAGNFLDDIAFTTAPCLNATTSVSDVTAGSAGATANAGDLLEYSTAITNSGGVTASGLQLADLVPAGTTEVSGSRSAVPSTLDPGGSVTVTFRVRVDVAAPTGTVIGKNDVLTYRWDSPVVLASVSATVSTTATGLSGARG